MKRTQIIELLNNIKATFMSFFSIMMFVALSIAIFCGISWTGPALQTAAGKVFEEGKLHDFEITYPYGLTEENYEELLELEGIDEIEGGYYSFQTAKYKGSHTMKVMSLPKTMDMAVDVKGSLPEKKGEIAVNSVWAKKKGIRIGDQLTFKHDRKKGDKDGMKHLVTDTYTVTAIMNSPAYVSVRKWTYGISTIGRGTIDCLGWVAPESFDTDQFTGYVQTCIRSDTLRGEKPFSKQYDAIAAELYDYLNDAGEDVSEERYLEIKAEAQAQIDKTAKKLEKRKKRIAAAEGQIADNENELAEGKTELAAGKKKLEEGLAKLEAGQKQYDEMKGIYDEAVSLYGRLGDVVKVAEKMASSNGMAEDSFPIHFEAYGIAKEQVVNTLNQMEALPEHLGNENMMEKYSSIGGKVEQDTLMLLELKIFYEQYDEDLSMAKQALADAAAMISAGRKEYESGLAKYERRKQQIAAGEALLAQKKLELESTKKKYEKGLARLEKRQKKADALQKYGLSILSRNGNGGVQAIQRYSSITDSLCYSMAMLFIIIGLLVSYSAVSRIVKDQIIFLGTKKALGLRSKEITWGYLIYSGTAVFTGAVIGFLLGTFGIEKIIAMRLGERFIMGTYASQFIASQALLLFAVEMALILLTTWFACRSILKMQAVDLLQGPKPPAGKQRFFENWRAWEKLSLLNKTIVNNCFNDKRRVLGTIIGVAGCTTLMVTAITMNDNIQKSFTRQYEDIYHYDTVVRYKTQWNSAQKNVEEVLKQTGVPSTLIHTATFSIDLPDGKKSFAKLKVPFGEESFGKLYSAAPKKELTNQTYEDGIWINDAYEKHFDADVGDMVSIMDGTGESHIFTIEGFFEHHLISYEMIMHKDVYERAFGEECKANAFLVDSGKIGTSGVREALNGVKGIIVVKNDYLANKNIFLEFSQVFGIVIAIYIVLSVLMAIVVLLDLNVVFIEEKRRELIVLMINGFSIKDARRYIYRDTIVLTTIGIICGVIFGSIMGNVTVMSVEPDAASFIKEIDWMACLIGAVSSAVFSYFMSKIALRHIADLSLRDINKM